MESNPCRGSSLLGIAHLVEGKLFQVQGVFGKTGLLRSRDYEASWIVALIHVLCIYILERTSFNICFVLRVM